MKTEGLLEERTDQGLNFDAHEFDGLRDALEREAQGIFGKVDQFARQHPLVCMGIAVAAGFLIASGTRLAVRGRATENES
jgi:ElaB/YqjD/DUF883 family membrane-anchored ribosome-binding protein